MSDIPCTIREQLAITPDGIDMNTNAIMRSSRCVYTGAIFSVDDCEIGLIKTDGSCETIRRQILRHAPAVVMLVHDTVRDLYLVEREYRAGSNQYAYGLPAGLIDADESVEHAALRELQEETGVHPEGNSSIETVGSFFSSEGMTDELAHVLIIRIDSWTQSSRNWDADEHVASAWVNWHDLLQLPIQSSNSVIAIQAEKIHRLRSLIS